MYQIKRLLHIQIILIYFTFMYSQGYLSPHKQAFASDDEASTTATTQPTSDEMSDEQVKNFKREFKALAMERLFDIKGRPSQDIPRNPNSKLKVPSAMFKQYVGYRDEVRDVVPDDRDFYGRINIDAVGTHESMWTANVGDYDIEVNMPSSDAEGMDSESFRSEDASHIALLPLASKYPLPENVSVYSASHSSAIAASLVLMNM